MAMAGPAAFSPTVPQPDPTLLTTEQLRRELLALRELLETRLDGMDAAALLVHQQAMRVPSDTDKLVQHLKELHDDRFAGIEKQFAERDVRSKAAELAAQVAVGAALQAQKEAAAAQNDSNSAAITKSEAATVKQMDGIKALLDSNASSFNDKIAGLNSRLDRGEGQLKGSSNSVALMISIVVAVGAVITGGLAVLNRSSIDSTPHYVMPAPSAVLVTPHQ